MNLHMLDELIVDNFAGGGGASTGIEMAVGRSVDIAINHDPDAIAMHKANHPNTKHYCESVWDVDPVEACAGRPVGLAWFSPDCKHFSKAKGGKPVDKNIRGLAWVVIRWAAKVKPRVIMLENVEEFKTWGPVVDGKPDKERAGETFGQWVRALEDLGYRVEWRELRACDYGAPTMRKRFFLIARCDGRPIVWPKPTHGDPDSLEVRAGILKAWRTAAEIIDWSLPCPSIFDTSEAIMERYGIKAVRPLAENTLQRIARGIKKYVLDNPEPFITCIGHTGFTHDRSWSIDTPINTVVSKVEQCLVTPTLIQYHTEQSGQGSRGQAMERPLLTVDAANRYALTTAFLSKQYGGGYTGSGNDPGEPLSTVTAIDHNALVAVNTVKCGQNSVGQSPKEPLHTVMPDAARFGMMASHLVKMRGENTGQPVDTPIGTLTAQGTHYGEVRSFLVKYYGEGTGQSLTEPLHTITAQDRFGLVTIHGEQYAIVDIGMRMLTPRELFRAQGFPDDYIIDHDHEGKAYPKTKQVARCGNSVPPPLPKALVEANLPELCAPRHAIAAV